MSQLTLVIKHGWIEPVTGADLGGTTPFVLCLNSQTLYETMNDYLLSSPTQNYFELL